MSENEKQQPVEIHTNLTAEYRERVAYLLNQQQMAMDELKELLSEGAIINDLALL
jgi:hypothetical protein